MFCCIKAAEHIAQQHEYVAQVIWWIKGTGNLPFLLPEWDCSQPSFWYPVSLIPSSLYLNHCSLSPTSSFEALLLNPCITVAYPCSRSVLAPPNSCMVLHRMSRNRGMEFVGVVALLCNSGTTPTVVGVPAEINSIVHVCTRIVTSV